VIKVLAMSLALHVPIPAGPWFGADKIKHFLMSAFVHSTAYSAARWSGASRGTSQIVAGLASASAGIWKEVHDKRSNRPFSVSDLVWDVAGATSAAALLNQAR
jgi:uncharacterized protein YfiM (DUF2279 family)